MQTLPIYFKPSRQIVKSGPYGVQHENFGPEESHRTYIPSGPMKVANFSVSSQAKTFADIGQKQTITK